MDKKGFVLPRYRGIEEAMWDVRQHARDHGIERCIGLHVSGKRIFDVTGDDEAVELPNQFVDTPDMFIVHGHPTLPCELSDADILSITAMGATGNMAVCSVDDTVSWTSGIAAKVDRDNPFDGWVVHKYLRNVIRHCATRINGTSQYAEWAREGEQWCVLAHLMNRTFLKSGFINDYHLRQGEVEREVLERWLSRIGKGE